MIRAAIYPRKSKFSDKSESIEVQIEMCKDYLKHNFDKYTIAIYDKDAAVTGHSIKKRKDFQRMMKDIKNGEIDLVLIQRYDRIARNTRDFCNLYHDMEKASCNLVSVSQRIDTTTPYGKKFMYDLASTAELEWALNSERHKDVNKYAMLKGKCNLSPYALPFGYKSEVVDGVRRCVIDKDTEHIVRDAIDYYSSNHGKAATTRYINDKYSLNKSHSFINTLLRSDFYHGQYRDNMNYCEPYFSIEDHERLRSYTSSYIRQHDDSQKYFLFTGLIKCPHCGLRMESQSQISRYSGEYYYYYRCYDTYRSGRCDMRGNFNEKKIENYLINNVIYEIEKWELELNETLSVQNPKTVDVNKYKDELKRLTNAYVKGRIEEKHYDQEYERITTMISSFEHTNIVSLPDFKSLREHFSGSWIDVYEKLDRKSKKIFWHNIIQRIDINDQKEVVRVYFLNNHSSCI